MKIANIFSTNTFCPATVARVSLAQNIKSISRNPSMPIFLKPFCFLSHMDIENLVKKLWPIIGPKIDLLWLEYNISPESRRDIESIIHCLAGYSFGFDKREDVEVKN